MSNCSIPQRSICAEYSMLRSLGTSVCLRCGISSTKEDACCGPTARLQRGVGALLLADRGGDVDLVLAQRRQFLLQPRPRRPLLRQQRPRPLHRRLRCGMRGGWCTSWNTRRLGTTVAYRRPLNCHCLTLRPTARGLNSLWRLCASSHVPHQETTCLSCGTAGHGCTVLVATCSCRWLNCETGIDIPIIVQL